MLQEHMPDGSFVKEISNLAKPQLEKLSRGQYIVMTGDGHTLIGEQFLAEPKALEVSTLDAIVGAWDSLSEDTEGWLIHVVSPTEVRIVDPVVGEEKQQFVYVRATAKVPDIILGRPLPLDLFIIQLQTLFNATEDRRRVLQFVGGLTAGLAAEIADDGVSQTVTTRKGLTRAGEPVAFDNPVLLEPQRSFSEIEQPISSFVLRLNQQKNGDEISATAMLLEADGGAWRREAILAIGEWLRARLPEGTTVLA